MSQNRKARLTKSWSFMLRWNRITAVLLIVGIALAGCKGDDEIDSNTDEYYVKYEVNSSTIYSGGKLEVSLNSETNTTKTYTINKRSLWEAVIGPVKKGFVASMDVKDVGTTDSHLKLYTNIYVSKNGSPFAIKGTNGSDTPRDNAKLHYTIDY